MLTITFPGAEMVFTAVWLLARIILWRRQRRADLKREALQALMYINLAVMIRFVFFPRGLVEGRVQPLVFDAETAFPPRLNLVPLVRLLDSTSVWDDIWNVAGNVLLFLPTGILLPLVYRKVNRFWKAAAAGALLSLCIEILQLPFPSRSSDVDDLILNTLGAAAGYGIFAAFRWLKRAFSGSRRDRRPS